MKRPLSAELALLAACCRWPPSPARDAAVRSAAAGPIDWARFERLVRRHRVTALAHNALRATGIAPPEVQARLSQATAGQARAALALAAESLRLQRMFDAAGVPAQFLKGVPLAILAYGDIGMKQSWDIDLLTWPEYAAQARELLEAVGYKLADDFQPATARAFDLLVELHMELEFFNPATKLTVELHWRLVENPHLLAGMSALSPSQDVPLGGGAVRTLADEDLFAYLCVHGARHGWSRLKWLADLNAFIARPGTDVAALHRAAPARGAGRTVGLGLILCHDVLGADLPGDLLPKLRADRITARLADNALRCLADGEGEGAMPATVTARSQMSHFFLMGRGSYIRHEALLKWTSPTDRRVLRLPRQLGFLYHLIRIPSWCWRYSAHLAAKLRPSRT